MDKMARNEKGYMLLLALIIMSVGTLAIGALLHYLGTSLLLATKSEETAVTYYAADAGVEHALWNMQYNGNFSLPGEGEEEVWQLPEQINGKTVEVNATKASEAGEGIYRIISTATGDDGSSASIESYISVVLPSTFNLSPFGDYAITSNGEITIRGDESSIIGDVVYVDRLRGEETITGNITQDEDGIDWWDDTQRFIDYFLSEVDESDPYPYPDPFVDATYTSMIGPLYREGFLDIYSSQIGKTLTLNGTVYVAGNLDIGKTNQDFTLDLNGHNIFVEGTIDMGGKTTIEGSGTIIAIGDVFFSPNIASGEGDFLFTMSVEGWTQLNPGNDYYGSVAGNTEITLQPGTHIEWVDPGSVGYELPQGESGGQPTIGILTYDIIG